ncbi:MAG: hypothetical protein IPP47_19860 [Bryobacterales bacterium]|nr:hypothetical protein [Bryobacterales bacterium]
MKNDRAGIAASLGPVAEAAWLALVQAGGIAGLPGERARAVAARPVDIGYRFRVSGAWGEAAPWLAKVDPSQGTDAMARDLEIETWFTDGVGAGCGTFRIRFIEGRGRWGSPTYLVDSADVGALFGILMGCAAGGAGVR